MSDFYITLPSNTSSSNTLNNYTVYLPRRVELVGVWEVALVELQYPHSWSNVYEPGVDNVLYFTHGDRTYDTTISLSNYAKIRYLIAEMKRAIKAQCGVHIELAYSKETGRVAYTTKPNEKLVVCPKLMYMLGYDVLNLGSSSLQEMDGDSIRSVAQHPPDMTAGFYALYVYCSIVAPQFIGNTESKILHVVSISGKHGEYIDVRYNNPHYIPVLQKQFDRVEVNIKNDTNQFVQFEYGKVVAKLHFRKKRR